MKVIFNLPSIPAYRSRFGMLKRLAERLDELTVVTTETDPGAMGDMPGNMSVVRLPAHKARFFMGLLEVFGSERPDIVHDTFGYMLPLGLLLKLFPARKYVTTAYGSAPGWLRKAAEIGYEDAGEINVHRRLRPREHLNARLCDFVMVNNQGFAADFTGFFGCPEERIAVVPNCIILDPHARFAKKKKKQFNILYVGHLSRMKGIFQLLEAHQELVDAGRDVRLTLVGSPFGADARALKARQWKQVVFAGRKPSSELGPYYETADLYVHPSYQEGMPRVVMEALAAGVPVVASDLPGVRALDDSGQFIRILPEISAASVKNSILREMESPRRSRRFFEDARARMALFSPENTASRVLEVYKKVL